MTIFTRLDGNRRDLTTFQFKARCGCAIKFHQAVLTVQHQREHYPVAEVLWQAARKVPRHTLPGPVASLGLVSEGPNVERVRIPNSLRGPIACFMAL